MTSHFPPVDLDRFHDGDDRLFTELVRTYSPRLIPQLRRYASARDSDITDLLQDVWLRAFQKRRGFDGRGSLFGWLLTICRTVGLAAARKRHPEGTAALEMVASEDDVAQSVERKTQQSKLLSAIDALPTRQREIVLLRIIEDKSTAETARLLGCAEGTVKAALHAALHNLKELCEEKSNERMSER